MTVTDMDAAGADELPMVTQVMEDYLRLLYKLGEEGDGWVSNSTIAERFEVSQPTVTSMFAALDSRGLIEREKYRPVRLTEAGERVALEVVRKHRLVETLLVDVFDYEIQEVDAEADVLEHHLSDRLCEEIERVLGMPRTDPHGDPIPDAELEIDSPSDVISLDEAPESTRVDVTRIRTQDDEVLSYLIENGIEPSARLTVAEKTPLGTVAVTVSETGTETSLPEQIAARVVVRPVETAELGTGRNDSGDGPVCFDG